MLIEIVEINKHDNLNSWNKTEYNVKLNEN